LLTATYFILENLDEKEPDSTATASSVDECKVAPLNHHQSFLLVV